MNPDGFLRDVLAAPERLERLLDAYGAASSPLAGHDLSPERASGVVLVGMGSSCFAAEPLAALLRARGVAAVAELASTGAPTAPRPGALVVGISASGATPETVEAFAGPLAAAADVILPLLAGEEEGGVACMTFQATLAVLLLLAGAAVDDLRPAVEAAAALRASRGAWLDELASLLDLAHTVYTIAPAERISSALQSALVLREGPRRPADAAETGDWLHVDVYLSKRPGYTALLFPGSRFDRGVMEWAGRRGARIVSVGRPTAGTQLDVPFANADDPVVALLVETGVAELAAAELWRRGVAAGDPALVEP